MIRILVKVTKEILERSAMCGESNKGPDVISNCAVVLAVREFWPHAVVNNGFIFQTREEHDNRWSVLPSNWSKAFIQLPLRVVEWIGDFDESTPDERRSMSPISFEIEVPETVIEKIGYQDVFKILSESRTLELASPKLLSV